MFRLSGTTKNQILGLARGRWLDIFYYLAPSLHAACLKIGRHVPCPVHGGKDGFRLFKDAAETGGGICNTCNNGSAMPNGLLVVQWVNGWDENTAVTRVAQFLGEVDYHSVHEIERCPKNGFRSNDGESKDQKIWDEANIDNDLLPKYLNSRGLTGKYASLRLHPALPYFDDGRRVGQFPAMVAKVQDVNGNDVCLLRTYLDQNGEGKANVPSAKKLTSPKNQGATTGAAIRLTPATDTIALAEGVETALAVHEATGVPVWATVSAHGMESIQLPPEIKTVELWSDNDASGVGQKAAEKAANRLIGEGRKVYLLTPPIENSDWLDILNNSCEDYLKAARKLAKPFGISLKDTSLPLVDDFPTQVLPDVFRNLVEEGAKAIGCPTDFLVVPLLVLAGVAIGATRVIKIKEGWLEGPRIYAALIARAGEKKSPAFKLATRPFIAYQDKLFKDFREKELDWRKGTFQYELDLEKWKRSICKGEAKIEARPLPPTTPILSQIYTTGATIEALAALLEQNPRGVVLLRDELAGWTKSFNQYRSGKGADKEYWLSFWNGSNVVINRKGVETALILSNPFVSVVGCIPPGVLTEITKDGKDGLLDRILFSYPDPKPLEWSENSVSNATVWTVEKAFEKLFQLDPDPNPLPQVVEFDKRARARWVVWIKQHYEEQNSFDFPEILCGPWAKLEAYSARFALILQLL